MSKIKLTVFFVCVFFVITYPQEKSLINKNEIIGIWQEGNPDVAAGLGNAYRFYKDKFVFQVSQFNSLSRLLKIKGKYEILDSVLILKVNKIVEAINGKYNYNSDEFNSWSYDNYKSKEIDYPLQEIRLTIVRCTKQNNNICVEINGIKYFRIDKNPDAFK